MFGIFWFNIHENNKEIKKKCGFKIAFRTNNNKGTYRKYSKSIFPILKNNGKYEIKYDYNECNGTYRTNGGFLTWFSEHMRCYNNEKHWLQNFSPFLPVPLDNNNPLYIEMKGFRLQKKIPGNN